MPRFCKYLIGYTECFIFFRNFGTLQYQIQPQILQPLQNPAINGISFKFKEAGSLCREGLPTEAQQQWLPTDHLGTLAPDSVTYTNLLQACTRTRSLQQGKLIHVHMIKSSFKPCVFLQNNLLNMYCKSGSMRDARQLFNKMPKRDVISWNSLISGYSQMGFYAEAIATFMQATVAGVKLDRFTLASALSICSRTEDLEMGKQIHGFIVVKGLESQVFLINSLIDMYSKCSRIDQARLLFDTSPDLDDVSWNSLIASYVRIGMEGETFRILIRMHRLGLKMNSFVLGSVLKSCSFAEKLGEQIHGFTIKIGLDCDVFVGSATLDLYAKIGKLNDAIKVFKQMPDRNVVAFNAMIAGFFRTEICEEFSDEALQLFSEMQKRGIKPSKFTFSSILKACNSIEDLEHGKQIHALVIKNNHQSDEFIGSTLVDLYSKSSSIDDATICFNSIATPDLVSWTSLICGFVRNGWFEQGLDLFIKLLKSGNKPDEFVISSVLSGCGNLAAARSGQQIQGYTVKTGLDRLIVVANSQIFMYAKSGDVDGAVRSFEKMGNRDVVSWSAIISSHAQHGSADEALRIFEEMKSAGVEPNHITFLAVLTACSHGGLVEEGFRYYESMTREHGIALNMKHGACIVDLLGRAGKLAEAERFIASSGFELDPVIWRALLGACRIHGDPVTGKRVAEHVIELEPHAAASYVLIYNIYINAGKQIQAMEIRDLMKIRGVKKEPGLSWIEIGKEVHSFVVGDKSHPKSLLIYEKLEGLLEKIKEMGYVPNQSLVYQDPDQEQPNKNLINSVNYHSEKLAVAFGMIGLPETMPIRVMKNLRVCGDCHTVMKFFSRVEGREIVLRDCIRFHRFIGGSCSCRDYW